MTTAWTKTLALALCVWPLGCLVSVGDDDGDGGSFGVSGNGGDSGSAGRDGTSGSGGFSGSGSSAGGTGETTFPAPTCDPEPEDSGDECVQCFKRSCCTEWLECDDQSCTDEWIGVAECVTEIDLASVDDLGMCITANSSTNDDFVQANTQALIDCAVTPTSDGIDTLCSSECFGTDIFYE